MQKYLPWALFLHWLLVHCWLLLRYWLLLDQSHSTLASICWVTGAGWNWTNNYKIVFVFKIQEISFLQDFKIKNMNVIFNSFIFQNVEISNSQFTYLIPSCKYKLDVVYMHIWYINKTWSELVTKFITKVQGLPESNNLQPLQFSNFLDVTLKELWVLLAGSSLANSSVVFLL